MSYMNSNMTVHRDKDFSYILTLFLPPQQTKPSFDNNMLAM